MNNIKYRIDKAITAFKILSQAEKELNLAKAFEVKKKMLLKEANNPKKIIELKKAIKDAEYKTELKKKEVIKIAKDFLYKYNKKSKKSLKLNRGGDGKLVLSKINEDFVEDIKKGNLKELQKLPESVTTTEILQLINELNELNEIYQTIKSLKRVSDEDIPLLNTKTNELNTKTDKLNTKMTKLKDDEIKQLDTKIQQLDTKIQQLKSIEYNDDIYEGDKYIDEDLKQIFNNLYIAFLINTEKQTGGFYKKNTKKLKRGGGIDNIKKLLNQTKNLITHKDIAFIDETGLHQKINSEFVDETKYNASLQNHKNDLLKTLNEVITGINKEIEEIKENIISKERNIKEKNQDKTTATTNLAYYRRIHTKSIEAYNNAKANRDRVLNSGNNNDKRNAIEAYNTSIQLKHTLNIDVINGELIVKNLEKELKELELYVYKMNKTIEELNSAKDKLTLQKPKYQ